MALSHAAKMAARECLAESVSGPVLSLLESEIPVAALVNPSERGYIYD